MASVDLGITTQRALGPTNNAAIPEHLPVVTTMSMATAPSSLSILFLSLSVHNHQYDMLTMVT